MTPDQERYDELMASLLDLYGSEDSDLLAQARERLRRDSDFRRDFDSLMRVADRLSSLGVRIHEQSGTCSIVEEVRDAIADHALEELAVAQASPYAELESALGALKSAFDRQAGTVSIVDDVMEAVAASHKSEEEIEGPYRLETARLRELGDDLAAQTPAVELVEPVERALKHHKPSNVVPLRARASVSTVRVSPGKKRWPQVLGWAAALLLAVGAWWYVTQDATQRPSEPMVAVNSTPDPVNPDAGRAQVPPVVAQRPEFPPEPPVVGQDEKPPALRNVGDVEKEPLTLQDVITARRRDLVNNSRAIAAMASMSEEDAIALLKEMDLSVEALIGATRFLSTEEAIAVLRAAIAESPDDPQLRLALARNLGDDPEAAGERIEQLTQMAAADTENGLPYFMLAAEYFGRGDADLGMDALSRGSAFEDSSAYALEGLRQHEAALIANGTPPDVARLLALSMSGETEYYDVEALRNELLDYGAQYEELGDAETAQQIYNAVKELGYQLEVGADMAVERQYGLETQHEAILAIQGIAEALQNPDVVALLDDSLNSLVTGIADVAGYIQARQAMILNPAITERVDWQGYLDHVIRNGDLNITGFID